MRASRERKSLTPLFAFIGLALLVIELSSYLAYEKHVTTLITELFRYDYDQKNWAFKSSQRSNYRLKDTLKIDMSETEFQSLSKEWNIHYKNKYRINGNPWIDKKGKYKARIKHLNGSKNKWIKGEIAMMGMLPDHHGNFERMSLKLKLKGNNRLFNKKAFALVLPETRSYFVDQLMNQAYYELHQGLRINTTPIWVQFRKNKPVVMLLEDKFDKYLIEGNQRRESILFEKGLFGHLRDIPGIEDQDIDLACNAELSDSARQSQLSLFVSRVFNDSLKGPFEFMDHEKVLSIWALGMVASSWHHWVDINMHWYYNPVNHKFEPTVREVNIDPNWRLIGDLKSFENRKNAYQKYLHKIQNEIVMGRPNFLVSYGKWGEKHIPNFWMKLDKEVGKAARKILKITPSYTEAKMPLEETAAKSYQNNIAFLTEQAKRLAFIGSKENLEFNKELIEVNGSTCYQDFVEFHSNTHLHIKPGTHITFKGKNGGLIIYGAAHFEGTANNPIIIEAPNGHDASIFIESKDSVVLEHVIFKGLSNLQKGVWKTPSSITIHQTKNVIIANCTFEENRRGDDYLNLFGCDDFTIKNCLFRNVKSDAFDSDFSNGRVDNTHFQRIGNDGIDGSGSDIRISNCTFDQIKDKAVSSGEKSNFTLQNSTITNSEIGLVSKDLSRLIVSNTAIKKVRLGAAIFQKKPEYGPAELQLDQDLNTYHYLVEKGSQIEHKGNKTTWSKNVKKLLYGNEYGSATQK